MVKRAAKKSKLSHAISMDAIGQFKFKAKSNCVEGDAAPEEEKSLARSKVQMKKVQSTPVDLTDPQTRKSKSLREYRPESFKEELKERVSEESIDEMIERTGANEYPQQSMKQRKEGSDDDEDDESSESVSSAEEESASCIEEHKFDIKSMISNPVANADDKLYENNSSSESSSSCDAESLLSELQKRDERQNREISASKGKKND